MSSKRTSELRIAVHASHSWKKVAFTAIKILLSAGVLIWLFNKAVAQNQFAEIASRPKRWDALLLAFGLCLTAHIIGFYRWKILVRAIGIPFSSLEAMRIGFIGLFFGLFAFGVIGGDTLRVYYAARNARNRLAEVMCSVFVDRSVGILTLFSIASVSMFAIGIDLNGIRNADVAKFVRLLLTMIATGTVLGWITVVVFLLSPGIANSKLVAGLKELPRAGGFIRQLSDAVLLYRDRLPTLAFCIGLSAITHLCFLGTIYLIAVGLRVQHPSLSEHFLIGPISMAGNALPLPGGLGGMELMLSFFYSALSSDASETDHGIVVAFTFRMMLLMLAVVGAIAWMISRRQIETVVRGQGETSS